jgi:hypothetical protein
MRPRGANILQPRWSGEWPKYRLNHDAAWMRDRWGAGERSRAVMSSIMRRRGALILSIRKPLSWSGSWRPTPLGQGGQSRGLADPPRLAASFNLSLPQGARKHEPLRPSKGGRDRFTARRRRLPPRRRRLRGRGRPSTPPRATRSSIRRAPDARPPRRNAPH